MRASSSKLPENSQAEDGEERGNKKRRSRATEDASQAQPNAQQGEESCDECKQPYARAQRQNTRDPSQLPSKLLDQEATHTFETFRHLGFEAGLEREEVVLRGRGRVTKERPHGREEVGAFHRKFSDTISKTSPPCPWRMAFAEYTAMP